MSDLVGAAVVVLVLASGVAVASEIVGAFGRLRRIESMLEDLTCEDEEED